MDLHPTTRIFCSFSYPNRTVSQRVSGGSSDLSRVHEVLCLCCELPSATVECF